MYMYACASICAFILLTLSPPLSTPANAEPVNVAYHAGAYTSRLVDTALWSNTKDAYRVVDGYDSVLYTHIPAGGFLTISLPAKHDITEIRLYTTDETVEYLSEFQLFLTDVPIGEPEKPMPAARPPPTYVNMDKSKLQPPYYSIRADEMTHSSGQFVTVLVSLAHWVDFYEVQIYGNRTVMGEVNTTALIADSVYFFEFNECRVQDVRSSGSSESVVRVDSPANVAFAAAGRGSSSTGISTSLSYSCQFQSTSEDAGQPRKSRGLYIPSPVGLPGGSMPSTMAAWVNLDSTPRYGYNSVLVSIGTPPRWDADPAKTCWNAFTTTPDNQLRQEFSFWSNGNDTSPTSIPLREWTHVAVVYFPGYERIFYINGVASVGSNRRFLKDVLPSSIPLSFGEAFFQSLVRYQLEGRLQEVGIWSRPLAAEEVQALYRRPVPIAPRSCEPSPAKSDWSSTFGIIVGSVGGVGVIALLLYCYRVRAKSWSVTAIRAANASSERVGVGQLHDPPSVQMHVELHRMQQHSLNLNQPSH